MSYRLVTIPISHYCEKARWALDHAGIPFVEEGHLQGFHYLHSLRAGSMTVPVLYMDDGRVLTESADIVRWADERLPAGRRLYPSDSRLRAEIERFELRMDTELGPAGRLWMYTYMFDRVPLLLEYARRQGVPAWEARAMPVVVRIFKPFARRRLNWKSDSRETSLATVSRILDEVGARIGPHGGGGRFLFGDRFTAADLTFASLMAPVIIPAGYGVVLPALEELPQEMVAQLRKWREHPASRFAQWLYDHHRRPAPVFGDIPTNT